jgi:hypothetical protein
MDPLQSGLDVQGARLLYELGETEESLDLGRESIEERRGEDVHALNVSESQSLLWTIWERESDKSRPDQMSENLVNARRRHQGDGLAYLRARAP